jgi:Domain of unknown function (DUF4185)
MFRLWMTAVFIFASSGASFAQPPVDMVGVAERVCEFVSQPDEERQCPSLPQESSTTYLRNLGGTVLSLPKGFDVARAVAADDDERGEGYYIYGEGAGKDGAPYLAYAPKDGLALSGRWEFFTGRGLSGSTNWVGFNRWQLHTDAEGSWNPGNRARVFSPDEGCSGFQVDWNAQLGRWLMLYGCDGAAKVRVALMPSGPWSEPTLLADAAESSGPILLPNLDAIGPTEADSRSTAIYWSVYLGRGARYQVMRAVLRQDGAQ